MHEAQYELVFLLGPGTFDQIWIEHLLPSMQALNIGPSVQTLGDFLPIFALIFVNGSGEFLVFFGRPMAFVGSVLVLCGASFVDVWILEMAALNLSLSGEIEFLSLGSCGEDVVGDVEGSDFSSRSVIYWIDSA